MTVQRKVRNTLKNSLYGTLYYSGMGRLYQSFYGRERGVICYHNVLPVKRLQPVGRYLVDVSRDAMIRHLKFLTSHFKLPPIEEISNPKAKGFFLTFDDGMLNNYTVLLPLLEEFRIKAMFAVCPAFVNGELPHIWRDHFFLILRKFIGKEIHWPVNDYQQRIPVTESNQLVLESGFKKWIYENQVSNVYEVLRDMCRRNEIPYQQEPFDPLRFQFMNWTQLRELQSLGHVIASHTHSHQVLKLLSQNDKMKELKLSKQILEQQLDTKITTIIYPYGGPAEVDAETTETARQAGYQTGFINVNQPYLGNTPMALPRFSLPLSHSQAQLHSIAIGLTDRLKGKKVY